MSKLAANLQKLTDGRTDLVFEILENTGNPGSQDEHGTPLLTWCAYYGDLSAVKFLISQGAELSILGQNFDLNGAAFHGHWQLCQFLIEEGADVNDTLNESGETPLHSTLCSANNPVSNFIVRLLLHHNADPNARTKQNKETGGFMGDVRTRGETPLHRAAAFGNAETIQLLLDAGGDRAIRDMNGDTPISWASWHLRPGKILALLAHGEHNVHPLHEVRIQSDHGSGWGSGQSVNQLGVLHL